MILDGNLVVSKPNLAYLAELLRIRLPIIRHLKPVD
jgi:hypothetical protein